MNRCRGENNSDDTSHIRSEFSGSDTSIESVRVNNASLLLSRRGRIQHGNRVSAKLKKKSSSLSSTWKEYFFVLQGGFIEYYSPGAYIEPKGSYVLLNCTVGDVKEVRLGGKVLYTIHIVWHDEQQQMAKHHDRNISDGSLSQGQFGGIETQNELLLTRAPSSEISSLENGAQQQQRQEKRPKKRGSLGKYLRYPGMRRRHNSFSSTSKPYEDDAVVDNKTFQPLIDQQQAMGSIPVNQDGNTRQPAEDSENSTKVSSKRSKSVTKVLALGGVTTVAVGLCAVTMGAGLVLVAALIGAGAGTSTVAGTHLFKSSRSKKHCSLHIGSESMETISEWRDTILLEIECLKNCKYAMHTNQQTKCSPIVELNVCSETDDTSETYFGTNKLIVADRISRHQDWVYQSIQKGVRVFVAPGNLDVPVGTVDSFPAKGDPILMCRVKLDCSPLDALYALIASPNRNLGGFWRSIRVIEKLDDQRDIIEVASEAYTLGGSLCVSPRLFYLARYWHLDDCGNYILDMTSCGNFESSSYFSTNRGFTRGLLCSIYTIAARTDSNVDSLCLVTHYCQCNPMGFIGYSEYFSHLYACKALLSFVDIKDSLDYEDFQRFEFDVGLLPRKSGLGLIYDPPCKPSHMDKSVNDLEFPLASHIFSKTIYDIGSFHTFKVRGQKYMLDQKKVPGGCSIGTLVRCDLFQLIPGERADNISCIGSCREHINRLISPGNTLFVLNYQIHKPAISFVAVWKVPDGEGSPAFQTLWKKFIDLPGWAKNGDSLPPDDFRTRRFKLLPMIVDGPWIVRKVIGSTPTLLAQKLTCRYFKRPGVFELDIDLHSSTIASNAVSLAKSHSKSIVVDMAVTIQGENEDELPESLVGAVRLDHLDLSLAEQLRPPENCSPDVSVTDAKDRK